VTHATATHVNAAIVANVKTVHVTHVPVALAHPPTRRVEIVAVAQRKLRKRRAAAAEPRRTPSQR